MIAGVNRPHIGRLLAMPIVALCMVFLAGAGGAAGAYLPHIRNNPKVILTTPAVPAMDRVIFFIAIVVLLALACTRMGMRVKK